MSDAELDARVRRYGFRSRRDGVARLGYVTDYASEGIEVGEGDLNTAIQGISLGYQQVETTNLEKKPIRVMVGFYGVELGGRRLVLPAPVGMVGLDMPAMVLSAIDGPEARVFYFSPADTALPEDECVKRTNERLVPRIKDVAALRLTQRKKHGPASGSLYADWWAFLYLPSTGDWLKAFAADKDGTLDSVEADRLRASVEPFQAGKLPDAMDRRVIITFPASHATYVAPQIVNLLE